MTSKFILALGRGLINDAPKFIKNNLQYEVIMGSQAYGVTHDYSDIDIYGWCIPPKESIFTHLTGYVPGFGQEPNRFDQYQKHHVKDGSDSEYDFTIYSIVKYLALVMENNPNMIDSLFVPENCVLHITTGGQMIRDQRRRFLHKGSFHKFKGYAYSQLHKIKTLDTTKRSHLKTVLEFEKTFGIDGSKVSIKDVEMCVNYQPGYSSQLVKIPEHETVRDYLTLLQTLNARDMGIRNYGMDVKFAYHTVRLLDEAEQILFEGDIDLQRNREQLKAIRKGEMSVDEIHDWFTSKEKQLEELYHKSTIPHGPDWQFGRQLLMDVIEYHYGSISVAIQDNKTAAILREMQELVDKYK